MTFSPVIGFAPRPVALTADQRSARIALRATVRSGTPRPVREALGRLAETDSELVLSLRFHLDDAREEHRVRTARGASAQRTGSSGIR